METAASVLERSLDSLKLTLQESWGQFVQKLRKIVDNDAKNTDEATVGHCLEALTKDFCL